jgi:hypothetical protein
LGKNGRASYNTAHILWAYDLALRDIAPFSRKVPYAENIGCVKSLHRTHCATSTSGCLATVTAQNGGLFGAPKSGTSVSAVGVNAHRELGTPHTISLQHNQRRGREALAPFLLPAIFCCGITSCKTAAVWSAAESPACCKWLPSL